MNDLERGIKLFNAGRYAEAVRAFEALPGGGENARFCLEHARRSLQEQRSARKNLLLPAAERPAELLKKGNHAGALRLLKRIFAGDPCSGFRLARDLWLGADFPRLSRPSAWAWFFLSSEAWRHGEDREALSLLNRASRSSRSFSWMRYYVAEILLRRLDLFELALKETRELIRGCPWLWEARCLRAEILMALGADSPLAGLGRLRVPEKSMAPFLAWRGALQLWSGDCASALKDLDLAVSLGNPDALCWRGAVLTMLGGYGAALEDLEKVLALDPKDPEAMTWRAEALRRLGRLEESLSGLQGLLAASEDALWARVNRALLHLELGDLASAREDFARLCPPFYRDAPDQRDKPAGETSYLCPGLSPRRMRHILEEALKLARGLRRSDSHLNRAWMRAAGVAVPRRPSPQARLLYWLRAKGLKTPPELVLGPGSLGEDEARLILGR